MVTRGKYYCVWWLTKSTYYFLSLWRSLKYRMNSCSLSGPPAMHTSSSEIYRPRDILDYSLSSIAANSYFLPFLIYYHWLWGGVSEWWGLLVCWEERPYSWHMSWEGLEGWDESIKYMMRNLLNNYSLTDWLSDWISYLLRSSKVIQIDIKAYPRW